MRVSERRGIVGSSVRKFLQLRVSTRVSLLKLPLRQDPNDRIFTAVPGAHSQPEPQHASAIIWVMILPLMVLLIILKLMKAPYFAAQKLGCRPG